MTVNIKWKTVDQKYGGPEERAFVGKIWVACISYNNSRGCGDEEKQYKYGYLLPQLNNGYSTSIEDAKTIVEKAVNIWFNATLVEA